MSESKRKKWNAVDTIEGNKVVTYFTSEPNGVGHSAHACAASWSIYSAKQTGGRCFLRINDLDWDVNLQAGGTQLVSDKAWVDMEWSGDIKYISDYFAFIFDLAKKMIMDGSAYMDFVSDETMQSMRGSVDKTGQRSEDADNFAEWHLDLFEHMTEGAFGEGECVLRAKINMSSPDMSLHDPVLYRVKGKPHYRTEALWSIYPTQDFACSVADFAENISLDARASKQQEASAFKVWVREQCHRLMPEHPAASLLSCWREGTLEFDCGVTRQHKIKAWIENGLVDDWDDPRLTTLSGLRP